MSLLNEIFRRMTSCMCKNSSVNEKKIYAGCNGKRLNRSALRSVFSSMYNIMRVTHDGILGHKIGYVAISTSIYALVMVCAVSVSWQNLSVEKEDVAKEVACRAPYTAYLTYQETGEILRNTINVISEDDVESAYVSEPDEEVYETFGYGVSPYGVEVIEEELPLGAGDSLNVLVQDGRRYYTAHELSLGLRGELVELAPAFIEAQESYGIDAVFLSAVAALESGWGSSPIRGTNLFGFGRMGFESREAGIKYVAAFLKENYLTEGGQFYKGVSVSSVQYYYCPNSTTWSNHVSQIMREIVSGIEDSDTELDVTSYMVVYLPWAEGTPSGQRVREFVSRRSNTQDLFESDTQEPSPMQVQQRDRIENLKDIGIVLPEYDGWGTNEPRLYDINLSDELQYYTLELCIAYGIGEHYELMLGKMFRESSFRINLISKTNDYGISQINKVNHNWLRVELGITDFLDAEQSILCGIHIMSSYLLKYKTLGESGVHRSLMSYNQGEGGATKTWNLGTHSTNYSRNVVETRDNIIDVGTVYK